MSKAKTKEECKCSFSDLRIAVKHKFESEDLRLILKLRHKPFPHLECRFCGGIKRVPTGKEHTYTREQLEAADGITALDIHGSEKVYDVCNLCFYGWKLSVATNRETDDVRCRLHGDIRFSAEWCDYFTPESAYCRHHDTGFEGDKAEVRVVKGIEEESGDGLYFLWIVKECPLCGRKSKELWESGEL